MKLTPITAKVQKQTKGGMIQEPLLNVGRVEGGSKSNCGPKSVAKKYSAAKQTAKQKGFTKTEVDPDFRNPGGNTGYTRTVTNMPEKPTNLRRALEVGANIATGGAYNAAKKALDYFTNKNKPEENFTKTSTHKTLKKVSNNKAASGKIKKIKQVSNNK